MSTKLTLNLSDSTNRAMEILSERLDKPSAEVIREALSLYWWVARECSNGSKLLIQRGDAVTELANSTLDALADGPPIPALGDEAPGPG